MPAKRLTAFQILTAVAVTSELVCCGCGPSTAEQRVSAELHRTGKQRVAVYPLAGRVTIDGIPPSAIAKGRSKVLVMLNNVSNPDDPPEKRPFMEADPDGAFRFSTYGNGDGVPAGKYVFTFAQLNFRKKEGYVGPDGLKNLFNDPEKNVDKSDFTIEHKAPGRKNYVFDLRTLGEEEATPGPKALIKIEK